MARVQLVIPDEDRARFVQQAKKEGLSLSAWLRTAAREKLEKQQDRRPFESVEELEDFYKRIERVTKQKDSVRSPIGKSTSE